MVRSVGSHRSVFGVAVAVNPKRFLCAFSVWKKCGVNLEGALRIVKLDDHASDLYIAICSIVSMNNPSELLLARKVACLVVKRVLSESDLFSVLESVQNQRPDNPVGYFRRGLQNRIAGFEEIIKGTLVVE